MQNVRMANCALLLAPTASGCLEFQRRCAGRNRAGRNVKRQMSHVKRHIYLSNDWMTQRPTDKWIGYRKGGLPNRLSSCYSPPKLRGCKTAKSIVGAVYDRAYFVDSRKNAR